MKLAFVGLGVMGYPMAGHLAMAGHELTVYNRTAVKARQWCSEYGGTAASTPAKAAANAQIVFSCVGNDDDVRQVLSGPQGVLKGIAKNATIVDHTTASAKVTREVAAQASVRDVGFLDAPVSGGQAGAENGQLTIMVGGDDAVFEATSSVMNAYAKAITHIGTTGSGQLAKMVNQICIAGVVQGLAEGLSFAKKAGLDPAVVIESISQGAAQSWQMENRWRTMVAGEYEFGFAVDWMRKDLAIALAEAGANGAKLELIELVDRFYAEIQAQGGSRWDTSSLMARLA